MPFHVEISRGMRHRASVFNLDERRLRAQIVEPWLRGARLELADKEWDPRECTIKILEGGELAPPELAHGQGWNNAERSAENVTERLVGAAAVATPDAVAVVAEDAAAAAAVGSQLEAAGIAPADWSAIRARIVAGSGGLERAAAILVAQGSPDPAWLFEAGLALGALGGRAIAAQLGDDPPPPQLRDVAVIRLDPDDQASGAALAERLKRAIRP